MPAFAAKLRLHITCAGKLHLAVEAFTGLRLAAPERDLFSCQKILGLLRRELLAAKPEQLEAAAFYLYPASIFLFFVFVG